MARGRAGLSMISRDEVRQLKATNAALTALVLKGYAVVKDFMPNIGRCALQDYERLNMFCVEAGRLERAAELERHAHAG